MIILQIYSLLLLTLLSLYSLNSENKDSRIGAFLLAPIIAYIIVTMIRL